MKNPLDIQFDINFLFGLSLKLLNLHGSDGWKLFKRLNSKAPKKLFRCSEKQRSSRSIKSSKFLNKTEHLRTWLYFAMSEQSFQALPADLQKIVEEVGKEMQAYEHELFLKDEAELEGFLTSKGMTIVNDVDQAAFAKLADGAMKRLMEGEYKYLKPLYDKIKEAEPK